MSSLQAVVTGVISNLAAIPNPGAAEPPGADKLVLILQWVLYIATVACVGAVVKSGIQIALSGHGRGGGGEHGMALVLSIVGAIVCGVAAAIVTAVFA